MVGKCTTTEPSPQSWIHNGHGWHYWKVREILAGEALLDIAGDPFSQSLSASQQAESKQVCSDMVFSLTTGSQQ